ncbi:MAG TPA: hypothetical protein VN372_00415 [Methanospirillum sp.]|nr:hypothetical protein [Methanospirillum sp.]
MEQRIREKVVREVMDILKAAGYDVHPGTPPVDLSAIHDGTYLVAVCSDDQEEASRFAETEYTVHTGKGEERCIKLLVTFDPILEAPDCVIWYPEEFARFAGEAVLSRVLGRELRLIINGATSSRFDRGSETLCNEGDSRVAYLPVKIHREDAEKKAGIPGVATLKFIPYWLFKYTSRGSGSFKDQQVSFERTGIGALNAINSLVIDIDPGTITRREIPVGAEVIRAQLNEKEADEKIAALLIKAMTKKVKARQVKGDAIYYEEKNVSPDRSNLSLTLSELFLPVWQIKGKKIVEINAYTGEKLLEPMDDGVEVF